MSRLKQRLVSKHMKVAVFDVLELADHNAPVHFALEGLLNLDGKERALLTRQRFNDLNNRSDKYVVGITGNIISIRDIK